MSLGDQWRSKKGVIVQPILATAHWKARIVIDHINGHQSNYLSGYPQNGELNFTVWIKRSKRRFKIPAFCKGVWLGGFMGQTFPLHQEPNIVVQIAPLDECESFRKLTRLGQTDSVTASFDGLSVRPTYGACRCQSLFHGILLAARRKYYANKKGCAVSLHSPFYQCQICLIGSDFNRNW